MHDHDPRDEDDEIVGDELEAEIMQADRPFGVESFGTTAEEERADEGLDRALARERRTPQDPDESLVLVDEGVTDEEDELVADAVTEHDVFTPPEEAALSEREDAPGATDHEDRHPVEDRVDDD